MEKMKKLPIEFKYKIFSYLPILDSNQKKLLQQIRTSNKIKEIIQIYKRYWRRHEELFNSDISSDSLLTDIIYWLNDDVASVLQINMKYQNHASKIFKVDKEFVNTAEKLEVFQKKYYSLSLTKMYLYELDDELGDCIEFMKNRTRQRIEERNFDFFEV